MSSFTPFAGRDPSVLFIDRKLPLQKDVSHLGADHLRRTHRERLFVDGLEIGHIIVADTPWEEARTNPGIDAEVFVFANREDRHIETENVFLSEISKYPGKPFEK
jgi:hypothetical protein